MTTDGTARIGAREVLRDRSVSALLTSQLLFTAVHAILATAIGKQVYDLTGRPLDLGLIGLAEFLPSALLVLVTGTVADRFDKRRVAAAALALELATAATLAWYASTDPTAVGPMFVFAGMLGLGRAFHSPAVRSIKPLVATPETLPQVIALDSTTWQLAAILGPVAAGFLYAADPVAAYTAAAVLAAGSMVSILLLRYRTRPVRSVERPTLRSAMEGLRVVRREPLLLGAISLDLFAVLFGGAVALLPAIAEESLGVGAVGLGFLRGAAGAGGAIVAVLLAARPLRTRVGPALFAAVGGFGLGTLVLGLTRSFPVALAAVTLLSAADMVSVFIRATLVPLATPPDALGRVHAVEGVFIGASNELGALESGIAATVLGLNAAVILGGAATIVVVLLWTRLFPSLRAIDTFEDIHARSPVGAGPAG